MRLPLLTLAALLTFSAAAGAADAPQVTLSAPRVATMKATTIVSQTLHIRSSDSDAEVKAIQQLEAKMATANVPPTGGPVFIFHQLPTDPTAAVDVEIGIPVADSVKSLPGYDVRSLPTAPSITAVYQGPTSAVGQAISDLFTRADALQQTPTGQLRIRTLYYEDLTSPNNITLLEIPVAPAK